MQKLLLDNISIQNFATFENQQINFSNKFNAIIGETGSGKSLILDALQLIFGARADRKLVRKNSEFASVEATFSVVGEDIRAFFEQIGFPFENDEIIIKRLIYPTGKSKSYLNYAACSLQILNKFSKRYIDLVGQFENQKLLSEDYQLILLDSFSKNADLKKKYTNTFNELERKKRDLSDLLDAQSSKEMREDYLRFQLNEIDLLNPSIIDEEQAIVEKDQILELSSQKDSLSSALNSLSENESGSAHSLLKQAVRSLENTSNFSDEIEKLYNSISLLEDVSYTISKRVDSEVDQSQLDDLVEKLNEYQRLKRKFGGTTDSLVQTHKEFKVELSELSDIDFEVNQLQIDIESLTTAALEIANKLHKTRVKTAISISELLTEKIQELRMVGASMIIDVQKNLNLTSTGNSKICFMAETNKGEGLYKIKDIASGGELSRMLLAVRQIMSVTDSISVFLFDEIDTGIGGETAVCTGKALSKVSQESQVIAITHLPQIAYYADKLINVSKHTKIENDKSRTYSEIIELNNEKEKNEFIKGMNPLEI